MCERARPPVTDATKEQARLPPGTSSHQLGCSNVFRQPGGWKRLKGKCSPAASPRSIPAAPRTTIFLPLPPKLPGFSIPKTPPRLTKVNPSQHMRDLLWPSHQLSFPAHLHSVWWTSSRQLHRTGSVAGGYGGASGTPHLAGYCSTDPSSNAAPSSPFHLSSLLTDLKEFKNILLFKTLQVLQIHKRWMSFPGVRNNSAFMVCRDGVESGSNPPPSPRTPGQGPDHRSFVCL